MPKKVFKINSKKKGPIVVIMGGVHGDEICGVKVIDFLKKHIKEIDRGTIYLIYGNPLAIKQEKRFVEMNLNRAFLQENKIDKIKINSYEYKRAKELMPILSSANFLLDIHSSKTPNAKPFVICEPHSYKLISHLPFQIVSSGWDKLEPGSTDAYVNKNKKYGICIECGYHTDKKTYDLAKKSALIFLNETVILKGENYKSITYPQKIINVYKIYITKTNFKPVRQFLDFELIKSNELIGFDGKKEIRTKKESFIIFCRQRKLPGEEAFLLAK
ncbi:MAG: succinylglutamate desuccinylase/aspartoacylase family protein [Nanoarchaeota archaeon]|nr:succinylglutamate desuccinylase/aspartoacylase family protein [Nanoarchaeota archaeon]